MSERRTIAAPVRWWRHPGALVAVHLHRAVFGGLAVLPGAVWLAALLGERAGVDATLLDHGGLLLPDVARAARDGGVRELFVGPVLALGFGVLAGLAVTAGWLDAMARPGRRPIGERVAEATLSVPPLLLGGFAAVLTQAAVVWVAAAAGVGVVRALHLAEPSHDLAIGLVVVIALGGASVVTVALDLLAAAIVGRRAPIADAAAIALGAFRARPLHLWSAHAMRAVTTLALLASAVLVAIRIGMRGPGDAVLALVVLEVALVAATALRGSWLGVALGAVRDASANVEFSLASDPPAGPTTSEDGGTSLPDGAPSSKTSPLLAAEVEDAPR